MNSKNAVHAQLFFEFKQFSKNDMRLSGQALYNHTFFSFLIAHPFFRCQIAIVARHDNRGGFFHDNQRG